MSYSGLGIVPFSCGASNPNTCCGSAGVKWAKKGSGNTDLLACNNNKFFMFYPDGRTVEAPLDEVEGLYSGVATKSSNVFSSDVLKMINSMPSDVSPATSAPSSMSDSTFYLGVAALVGVIGVGAWYALRK